MYRPSLSTFLAVVFIFFISRILYDFYVLFKVPECKSNKNCIKYSLSSNSRLQLIVFGSVNEYPRADMNNNFYPIDHITNIDHNSYYQKNVEFAIPRKTKRNGTYYLHMCFLPQESHINSNNLIDIVQHKDIVYVNVKLSDYIIPERTSFQLLKGQYENNQNLPVTHLQSAIGLRILSGVTQLPSNEFPFELADNLRMNQGKIAPLIYYDILDDRLESFIEITSNSTKHDVLLKISPIDMGRLRFLLHIREGFKEIKSYGFSAKMIDQVKEIFSVNIYLLYLTIVIIGIHTLFDFLALKNDFIFWKTRKNLVGISIRTVLWKAFSQSVILLYLTEEETSFLVLFPTGLCVLLEWWKVLTVLPIDWKTFKMKKQILSQKELQTRKIDAEGMYYLTLILVPLCIGGCVFSIFNLHYKSWYSWIIHSLVNGVYAFGFLFMLPQLLINYKLKSVAHLPWRSLMYKAFNTFIDDFFAFLITMPTTHRIACFRDDVVFVVYLFQRWLYPVDQQRLDTENDWKEVGETKKKQ